MAKPWNAVTPAEYTRGNETKTRWVRCGVAFEREGGGFSILLDALPVNGRILVMPPREDDRGGGRGVDESPF